MRLRNYNRNCPEITQLIMRLSIFGYFNFLKRKDFVLTQSKFQTITRSAHGKKFNCITVNYNGTRQSMYNLQKKINLLGLKKPPEKVFHC